MYKYIRNKARPIPPKVLLSLALLLALALASWIVIKIVTKPIEVTDFDSCVKAGGPILESYPEQCTYEGVSHINPAQALPKPY